MFPPFLISIVVTLIIVGIILALIQAAPFIDAGMKVYIRYVIYGLTAIWLILLLAGAYGPGYYPYPPYHR